VHDCAAQMNFLLIPKELRPFAAKVEARQRISEADALDLYRSNDLNALGIMASAVREQKNGNYATYIHNRYINYSNICVLSCQFCAFAAKKRDAHAFEYAMMKLFASSAKLFPSALPKSTWSAAFTRRSKKIGISTSCAVCARSIPVCTSKRSPLSKCATLAQRIFRMSIRDTLELLREHGLGSITGGGAEIFDPIVRDKICRGKETAAEWADVHRTWHSMGGRSTCTMLYGHIETLAHRVDHLRRLRELQDETGGFTASFRSRSNRKPRCCARQTGFRV